MIRTSAPGKLLLVGEYAVLEGAEALVAAIDRRVSVSGSPQHEDGSAVARNSSPESPKMAPEVVLTLRHVEARGFAPVGSLIVDVSQLREKNHKIGIGSSAAAAAAVAGYAHAVSGASLDAPSTQASVLEDALAGHRAVAPDGSGVDVAASVYGGFLRVRKTGDGLEIRPVMMPGGLALSVVWTGVEARTSTFLQHTRELAARDAHGYRAHMASLGRTAEELVASVLDADVSSVIEAARTYGCEMGALGRDAQIDIVTGEHARIAELADAHGGSAKPSGAGGGDVAIAFFADAEARLAFERACAREGFLVLTWALGADGVRRERAEKD